jgi:hypothetical protein
VSFLRKLFSGGSDDAGSAESASGGPADDAEWLSASETTFDAANERHRVTIWMRLYDPVFETTREQLKVFALENEVMRALEENKVGEHDTNSLEKGFMAMRLIGDDADAIVAVIMPFLADVPEGSYLAVRHGPAKTGEDRIELGPGADDSPSDEDPAA